jgi:hypothetical protein
LKVMGREDETRWEVKPFSASEETHASLDSEADAKSVRRRGRLVRPKDATSKGTLAFKRSLYGLRVSLTEPRGLKLELRCEEEAIS